MTGLLPERMRVSIPSLRQEFPDGRDEPSPPAHDRGHDRPQHVASDAAILHPRGCEVQPLFRPIAGQADSGRCPRLPGPPRLDRHLVAELEPDRLCVALLLRDHAGRSDAPRADPPRARALGELAGAAGLRWTVEECFERAKDDLGLDHCEARPWHGWHRHMSLCLAAAAFLARLAANLRRATWGKANERSPAVPAAA